MSSIINYKRKILILGSKKSTVRFFINKNFKKLNYQNGIYQNDSYKIQESYNVSDLKKISKIDKIYFVCDYINNFSNFPVSEVDIIMAKELISFLYEDLKFNHTLTIVTIPKNQSLVNPKLESNVKNYFNFTDKANIEVLIYDEDDPYVSYYTCSVDIKKLYHQHIYDTIISDVQNYMVDNELYPGVNLNIFEKLYYKRNYWGLILYSKKPVNDKFNGILCYDFLGKKKFFEGKFYGNIMKSGKFYSEDGELLFEGDV